MHHSTTGVNWQYGLLHNRKTAGTALKSVIEAQLQRTPSLNVTLFDHAMTFPLFVEKYPIAKAIFFVREPLSRFVSGFYSRLRQGQPRYHYPWSRRERKAFARFNTPNQLAEAISSKKFFERRAAMAAMRSVRHVKHTYFDFLGDIEFLERHLDQIAFIGLQESLNTDFRLLQDLLQIDADLELPHDDLKAHRNPKKSDTTLSEKARANLEAWFEKDIKIYQWCLIKRQEIQLSE